MVGFLQGPRSFFSEIISSINDIKFSRDGRYILSRDYMTLKLWDMHMENAPVGVYPVHEVLRGKVRRARKQPEPVRGLRLLRRAASSVCACRREVLTWLCYSAEGLLHFCELSPSVSAFCFQSAFSVHAEPADLMPAGTAAVRLVRERLHLRQV